MGLAAILLSLGVLGSSRADWKNFGGTYTGTWKSSDTDGHSYSGKATVKIKGGAGNAIKLSMKTTFLGNPINANGRAPANGQMTLTVSNPILGTVSGTAKATASGSKGSIKGQSALYGGTATVDMTLQSTKNGLTAKGTLVRALPFLSPKTLTFSFSGKKK